MTQREMYELIKVATVDNAQAQEIAEFCDKKIEQLARKNSSGSSKPSKTQVENAEIRAKIVTYLEDMGVGARVETIANAFGITHNRASALLGQLVKSGEVERYHEKRIAYFKVASATEEVE